VLTEHGVALQAGAQRVLEAVQAARDDVAAVSGQVRGTVTLACTLNTGTLDLAEMLERVRDRHPGVIVKLRQFSSGSAGNLQSVRDGSVDIALGWPLRYSHSPAEVIDTRDVDSLARIITVIARSW